MTADQEADLPRVEHDGPAIGLTEGVMRGLDDDEDDDDKQEADAMIHDAKVESHVANPVGDAWDNEDKPQTKSAPKRQKTIGMPDWMNDIEKRINNAVSSKDMDALETIGSELESMENVSEEHKQHPAQMLKDAARKLME